MWTLPFVVTVPICEDNNWRHQNNKRSVFGERAFTLSQGHVVFSAPSGRNAGYRHAVPRFEEWEKNHGYDLSSDSSSGDSGEESDKDKEEKGRLIAWIFYLSYFATINFKKKHLQRHVKWKIVKEMNLNENF